MFKTSIYAAFLSTCLIASGAVATTINPFDFNVYSLGDIGTEHSGYRSDFQGIAGAGGSAYFNGFSLHDVAASGPGTPYSLYAGGNAYIGGSINNGGIEAGGNVHINGASVDGNLNIGGSLYGTGGSISGNAYMSGTDYTGYSVSVSGNIVEQNLYQPTFDLQSTSNYFLNASDSVGKMQANTSYTEQWGKMSVALSSGTNVLELKSDDLKGLWNVDITGPDDATLFINITDDDVSLSPSLSWTYSGGIGAENVLLNLAFADKLKINGGSHTVNILAPNADVQFPYGLVTGNLITGSLTGGGQVNSGAFVNDRIIPEPTSLLLLGLGGLVLIRRKCIRR